MGLNRRLELLEAAERSKSWIIEDDYDSEFRYVGRPLPALQGLDTTGRVIYVGTFSKVLFPALRLGYVVAPPSLVDPFARAIAAFSRGAATPLQAVIASFIEEGHFTAHIRRMRKLYKERHDLLIEEAEKQLTGLLDVLPVESGMHAMGWLPDGMAGAEVSKKAALVGISAPSLSDYCLEPYAREGLLLGFTCVPPKEMARSVGKLREVLETANN